MGEKFAVFSDNPWDKKSGVDPQVKVNMMFLKSAVALRRDMVEALREYVKPSIARKVTDHLLLSPTFARSRLQEITHGSDKFVDGLLERMQGWKGLSLISPAVDPIYQMDDLLLMLRW